MEEYDLTPWLAENLDVLEAELGMGLELVEREHRVGRYELDLLLRAEDGRVVIVENQFGRSDHGHLGQLLAYAAGTEAEVVVWIAESFTDEHLAALQWMNNSTAEGVAFFALTLAAVRIGDSMPAPFIQTAERPNEWVKKTVSQRSDAKGQKTWSWETIQEELNIPNERVQLGREVLERLLAAAPESWTPRFNRGWVSIRDENRKVVLAVGVDTDPINLSLLGFCAPLSDPLPSIPSHPRGRNAYWWRVESLDQVPPDVTPLIRLVQSLRGHEAKGDAEGDPLPLQDRREH